MMLPDDRQRELAIALAELLLGAAAEPTDPVREETHEPQNIGGSFEAARHHLYSSVITRTGDSQPGEPAPAIWFGRPRSPTWLPAGRDNRRGSWTLWIRPSGAPRIPASGCGSLHGTGWRRALH